MIVVTLSPLTEVHTLLWFPSFLPEPPFLFQGSILDTSLHLVVMSPRAPLGCNSFSSFLFKPWFLYNLSSFEEDWSDVLYTVSQFGVPEIFLMIRLRCYKILRMGMQLILFLFRKFSLDIERELECWFLTQWWWFLQHETWGDFWTFISVILSSCFNPLYGMQVILFLKNKRVIFLSKEKLAANK